MFVKVPDNDNETDMIKFEVKPEGTPFFGATSRAERALLDNRDRSNIVSPRAFCDYIEQRYASDQDAHIEFISFYNFRHRNRDNFHFTIAVVYTKPDRYIRDKMFEDREEITKETGWYPLVTGSRAKYTDRIMDKSTYQK